MAASSAVWFEVRFSCVSCIPVVVTMLQAFSGKLPDFFISCLISLLAVVIAGNGIALDKGPRGLGILESGKQAQYCKIDFTAPQC